MQRTALVAVVALLAGTAAAADYTIVRRTRVNYGAFDEQTEYWSRGRLVVRVRGERTIVDFARGALDVVDDGAHVVRSARLDDVRRQLSTLSEVAEALPPTVRDALGLASRGVRVAPTGNETNIAGQRAMEYALAGTDVQGWVWLAKELDPGRLLGSEAATWWETGGPLRGVGLLADLAQAIARERITGMPVWVWATIGAAGSVVTLESQVTDVRSGRVPEEVLAVPASYRREAWALGS